MKLIEALEVLKQAPSEGEPFEVCLVSSFTPLHLQTFLAAEFQILKKERRVQITTGLYGDIRGNLRRLIQSRPDAAVIVLEWQDFDARLGLRNLGDWGAEQLPEIV